jgi:CRISPR/Cas system Type II protein with McrA/HNH and RuvC-like nuclease domain
MNKNRSAQFEKQCGKCHFCRCEISIKRRSEGRGSIPFATWDHLTPKSRGGNNVDDNLVLVCGTCNTDKGDKTEAEYLDYRKQELQSRRKLSGKMLKVKDNKVYMLNIRWTEGQFIDSWVELNRSQPC